MGQEKMVHFATSTKETFTCISDKQYINAEYTFITYVKYSLYKEWDLIFIVSSYKENIRRKDILLCYFLYRNASQK